MTPLQTELAGALDQLEKVLADTPRRRSLTEAPLGITNAYAAYLYTCGFASLGAHDPARTLLAAARSELTKRELPTRSPIHGHLVATCEARVEHAFAGARYDAPVATAIAEGLGELERIERYKVDRFREASLLFELTTVDAMGAFSLRRLGTPVTTARVLRDVANVDVRADLIRETLEAEASLDHVALANCLDGLVGLAEDPGVPLLVDAVPKIAGRETALDLYTRALTAAAHLGWSELAPALVEGLRTALRTTRSPEPVVRVVSPTLRALRYLGHIAETAMWIDELERKLGDAARLDHRLVLAAARTIVGDSHGAELLEEEVARLDVPTKNINRLELHRSIALAYAHADVATGARGILALTRQFAGITDTLGTNTHYCYSVVCFVDALVYGLIGLDFSRPGWRPRE